MDRVRTVARQLNYAPNRAGRALATSRSGAIALMVPGAGGSLFAEILRGCEDESDVQGLLLLLGRSERLPPDGAILQRMVNEGLADGFIIQRHDSTDDETIRKISHLGPPSVLLISEVPGEGSSVLLDDAGAGRTATEHLLSLGHSKIGFIAGPDSNTATQGRVAGFRAAMAEAGFEVQERWVERIGVNVEHGEQGLHAIAERGDLPTAIVAANVNSGIGAMRAAIARGIRVPEDLSVAAIHDSPTAALVTPSLTAVRMPMYELGRAAVQALATRLNGGASETRIVKDPKPELIKRESTARPTR
jgi:LacI family transcriptional regulator